MTTHHTESRMRVIDMFAGIAGMSLGLERTGGFKTVAFAEVDPYASRVLAKHWPEVPNLGDVTTAEYPDADVITAGFPCQDLSLAGAGAGLAGSRSGLYRHVVRAVRLVRPRWVLLENVAALLGRGMGRVLGDLAEVGYDAEWHCIPASAVGAPHRRDRVWIAANPGGEQHEGGRAPLSGPLAEELSGADTDASGERRAETGELRHEQPEERAAGIREEVADAAGGGREGPGNVEGAGGQAGQPAGAAWWATEPDVGRVAHGVPARVDRLRCLGNAVVPQIPELIGRAILHSERAAA